MMQASFPALIRALLNPKCYPDHVENVEVIETHASWLLLVGEYAYKIKKPITLPFLDYGTLSKRQMCCETELQLNRRFAPNLYLKVVSITGTSDCPRIDGNGVPIEYAVKMRRFNEAGRLDHVCDRGELQLSHLSDLASTIINFHSSAAVAPTDSHFGSLDTVIEPALENFDELHLLVSDQGCMQRLNVLLAWTKNEYQRLIPNFLSRKATGHVRECHGDLHLGNIVIIDDDVRLFDCIEFNEDLRWIDVASDIAFAYMDLLDHRQPELAGWLLNEWLSMSGDFDAMPLLRFYAIYRTLVRAKVAAIRANQNHDGLKEICNYLELAEKIISPQKLQLTITHGLAGCGKTTASTNMLLKDEYVSTVRLRSDVERKRLFCLTATTDSNSTLNGGIYSQRAHLLTYRHLYYLAESLLAAGWSVIVDAAFLKRSERDDFCKLALKSDVEFRILSPQASLDELRTRITKRLKTGQDASEATLDVLDKQIGFIEPLDDVERSFLLGESLA